MPTYRYHQSYLSKVVYGTSGLAVVAFSPDGTRLATCDDKTVQIWDIAGG